MPSAEEFFTPAQKAALKEAVLAAELETSGEVRVYIESTKGKKDVMKRAAEVFEELDLHETEARNGVLFYLAVEDRQFAILGDKGINEKTGNDFWHDVKNKMQADFREGKFTEGLVDGIMAAGEKLKAFFPHTREDINELSDDIVFG